MTWGFCVFRPGQPLRGVVPRREREIDKSVFDSAKDKAEQFVGDAKEKLGQQKDQQNGEGQEQGQGMKDRAEDAMRDAKERFGN